MLKKSIISDHFDSNNEIITLNEIQKKYRDKYHNFISQKKIIFENLNCPCGSSSQGEVISSRDKFGLQVNNIICIECGLIRQSPTLTDDSLSIFYDQIYRPLYLGRINAENLKSIFESLILKGNIIYDFLNKYIDVSKYKKVLEIGCSAGGILKYFQERNHLVTGCDFDSKYIEYGKKNDLDLIVGGASSLQSGKKFDLIILSHVVEHFKDLKQEFSKIFSLLHDNGVIYIQVPGIYNEEYYKSYDRCDFLFYIQNAHNYYFTKNTFLNTLTYLGIKIKTIHIDEKVNIILQKKNGKNHIIQNEYDNVVNFLKKNDYLRKYKKIYYFLKNVIKSIIIFILKKLFIFEKIKSFYLKYIAKQ